jgi:hypothetical protein
MRDGEIANKVLQQTAQHTRVESPQLFGAAAELGVRVTSGDFGGVMSTTFNIRIELAVGPTVWARLEVCHPDVWDVPATKTFALMVVVETYDDMKKGWFYGQHQPMSRIEAANLIANHPQRAKLEHWLELYGRFDGPSFTAEADEAILDVELVNEEGNPKQEMGDADPKATMVFTVKDATIVTHVVGGFMFDSAMCDCRFW